jgi:geranylgeranyl pyrophosphate synthase
MSTGTPHAELVARFEAALGEHADTWFHWPERLREASRYVLSTGGKRVRPLLALLGAEAVGGAPDLALPFAVAVELVHTYSLVHDDLPAMDDDAVRRGQPTCHVAYDEATAILVGDGLLTAAFEVLAHAQLPAARALRLVGLLAAAAGGAGMVGGQVLDIGGGLSSLAELEAMQRGKTGALIQAAVLGGAFSAGASEVEGAALSAYGAAVGLLFQITDDLLDAEQDAERDSNSYLHHLALPEVKALAEATAAEALGALASLGSAADGLRLLVAQLTHRTV